MSFHSDIKTALLAIIAAAAFLGAAVVSVPKRPPGLPSAGTQTTAPAAAAVVATPTVAAK